MRIFGKLALALAAVALVAGPALAQRGGGGGGFPRGGGGGGVGGILGLLQNKSVQKELNIDDADVGKIPEAVMKALEKVLKPEQLKRLKEIELQTMGARAFGDAKIQTALKITDDQKEKLKTIQEDAGKELRELFTGGGGGRGGDFAAMREKMQKLNKETMKKLVAVLDSNQKKSWTKMIGEPFEIKYDFPMGGRGGRGARPRNNN